MNAAISKRVLIIDDDAMIREVVKSCLEDLAGWYVPTASSGAEGLLKVIEEKPDAIVLDMMMPGMDGLTFLQRLRANSETQSIPVILLTAKVEFTDPQRISTLGLAGAISTPFDPYTVVEQIATFLGWTVGK